MSKMEFYKETEFKKTEIGEIPREWEVKRLGEVANIKGRIGWHGLKDEDYLKSGDHYLVRGIDFKNGKIIWEKCVFISKEWYEKDPNIQLKEGDILITKDGTIGKVAFIDKLPKKATLGTGIFRIRLECNNIRSNFLFYTFQSFYFKSFIEALKAGSTLSHLYQKDIINFKIPLPSLSEQKAIAKVLKDFDDLLEVIEEKIKTLQRIKKGLMEVYFTKGVFEHKEFKDTEIGRIPKEWKVKRLGEVVIQLKAGGTPKTSVKEYYENGDIPFVKIEDLTTNGKYLKKTLLKITEKGLRNSSAWLVPQNSLLLAMYGSLGEVSINKIQVATNQAILGIIPNSAKLGLEYLYYWLLYFKPKWNLYAKTTTQANLTKQIVENSFIPLPPLEEQKAIAQRLKTIDDQIENLKNQKETLQKIKKKFMDLLLTGKVRVKEIKEEDGDV